MPSLFSLRFYSLLWLVTPMFAALAAGLVRWAQPTSYRFSEALHLPAYFISCLTIATCVGVVRGVQVVEGVGDGRSGASLRSPKRLIISALVVMTECAVVLFIGNWILEIHSMFFMHLQWMVLIGWTGLGSALVLAILAGRRQLRRRAVFILLLPQIAAGWLLPREPIKDLGDEKQGTFVLQECLPLTWAYKGMIISQALLNPLTNCQQILEKRIQSLTSDARMEMNSAQLEELDRAKLTLAIVSGLQGDDPDDIARRLRRIQDGIKSGNSNPELLDLPKARGSINAEDVFVNLEVRDFVPQAENEPEDYRHTATSDVLFGSQKRWFERELQTTTLNAGLLVLLNACLFGLIGLLGYGLNRESIPAMLRLCSPLTDAVKVAAQFLRWNVYFSLLCLPLKMAGATMATMGKIDVSTVLSWTGIAALGVLLVSPISIALGLLLNETGGKQDLCLFLRAFQSDASSDQLRAWLKAGLGHHFKLSGIRPPAERAAFFSTLLSPLSTGLRYLGSRQFEMEAPDHNWLARLLASFAKARFVFIDGRVLTSHVLDEIQLAWQVFGRERIIFILDDEMPLTEWRSQISRQIGDDVITNAAPLNTMIWPKHGSPDATAFQVELNRLIAGIPEGNATIPQSAFDMALARVGEAAWPIRSWECSSAVILFSLIGVNLLAALISDGLTKILVGGYMLLFQFLFWRAWNRTRHQRNFAKQINPTGPPSARRLWGSGALMASWVSLWLCVVVGSTVAYQRSENREKISRSRSSALMLGHAAELYCSDHGGLPPLTDGSATSDLLVDLASDQRLLTILAEDYLLSARVEEGRYLDGWGTPFRVGFDANYDEKVDLPPPHKSALGSIVVLSAGPDKTWGTADDLVF